MNPSPADTDHDTDADAGRAAMLDLSFVLEGSTVPLRYREALASAVEATLPWLAEAPGSGVHRLNLAAGAGTQGLLSRRTRLVLRLPRARVGEAAALSGRTLDLQGHRLEVGAAQARELLPWGTLYAHAVAAAEGDDETAFLQAIQDELQALGLRARVICGREQALETGAGHGFSVLLDGLSPEHALLAMQAGLGGYRRLGYGMLVPHKSAAAVGAPP